MRTFNLTAGQLAEGEISRDIGVGDAITENRSEQIVVSNQFGYVVTLEKVVIGVGDTAKRKIRRRVYYINSNGGLSLQKERTTRENSQGYFKLQSQLQSQLERAEKAGGKSA